MLLGQDYVSTAIPGGSLPVLGAHTPTMAVFAAVLFQRTNDPRSLTGTLRLLCLASVIQASVTLATKHDASSSGSAAATTTSSDDTGCQQSVLLTGLPELLAAVASDGGDASPGDVGLAASRALSWGPVEYNRVAESTREYLGIAIYLSQLGTSTTPLQGLSFEVSFAFLFERSSYLNH